ncbi:MAG: hypothetical protein GC164_04290 [Phycisphaera sp.]|nr:hypothetical protein [Phycisphaera sp.]
MNSRPYRWIVTAFTLVELLVVLTVIVIVLGIVIPVVTTFLGRGEIESAVNTISVAAPTARAYAGNGTDDATIGATYSGAAMLFTPANEIRFVQNDQRAKSTGGNYLEALGTPVNGYRDVTDLDYLKLPEDVGVVGIARGASGAGGLYLYAPPFAIRFNKNGGLVAGISTGTAGDDRIVFYDANYDGQYRVSAGAGYDRATYYGQSSSAPYDPAGWDPSSYKYPASGAGQDANTGKYKLPFEYIETVIGVAVFSKSELEGQGLDLASQGVTATTTQVSNATRNWILSNTNGTPNSKIILFSRLTGNIMRE